MGRLKQVIEAALVRGGPAALARALHRRHAVILAYHNVVPAGQPGAADHSLHLPHDEFGAHLDIISRTHEIVPLARVIEPRRSLFRPARPLAAITFDDAYLGAMTAGVAELARRGLPATVFIAPAFVGGRTFWWDACAPQPRERDAFREQALTMLKGDDPAVRAWAVRSQCIAAPVPAHATCASLADLQRAVTTGCITVGAHSWSHRNLALLDPAELRREMERPLAWLRANFPLDAVSPCFAYPYGITTPAVEAACAAAGYTAALRVDGGPTRLPAPAPHRTPRLNVPAGLSRHGLALRLAGLL